MEKDMILFIRTTDINPDTRLEKYLDYCKRKKLSYKVLAWNRSGEETRNDINADYFNFRAKHGGGIFNIFQLFVWFIFVFSKVIYYRRKLKLIHACDLDGVLPCFFARYFLPKKVKISFDVFDSYAQARFSPASKIFKIIDELEGKCLNFCDKIILCEKERIKQINIKDESKILILPNIPSLDFRFNKKEINYWKVNLSYVGVLSRGRGIEDLLLAVSRNKNVILNIAGFGELEALVKSYNVDNIIFHGKVSYNESLQIQYNSDYICAFYYTHIRNHIFAAPNKYYESLFLGVPLLTNSGTYLAEKVLDEITGSVISEGYDNINNFLLNVNLNNQWSNKALWKSKYKNYVDNFMSNYFSEF